MVRHAFLSLMASQILSKAEDNVPKRPNPTLMLRCDSILGLTRLAQEEGPRRLNTLP